MHSAAAALVAAGSAAASVTTTTASSWATGSSGRMQEKGTVRRCQRLDWLPFELRLAVLLQVPCAADATAFVLALRLQFCEFVHWCKCRFRLKQLPAAAAAACDGSVDNDYWEVFQARAWAAFIGVCGRERRPDGVRFGFQRLAQLRLLSMSNGNDDDDGDESRSESVAHRSNGTSRQRTDRAKQLIPAFHDENDDHRSNDACSTLDTELYPWLNIRPAVRYLCHVIASKLAEDIPMLHNAITIVTEVFPNWQSRSQDFRAALLGSCVLHNRSLHIIDFLSIPSSFLSGSGSEASLLPQSIHNYYVDQANDESPQIRNDKSGECNCIDRHQQHHTFPSNVDHVEEDQNDQQNRYDQEMQQADKMRGCQASSINRNEGEQEEEEEEEEQEETLSLGPDSYSMIPLKGERRSGCIEDSNNRKRKRKQCQACFKSYEEAILFQTEAHRISDPGPILLVGKLSSLPLFQEPLRTECRRAMCSAAVMSGDLQLLQYFKLRGLLRRWESDVVERAARFGHLHIVQWGAHVFGDNWSYHGCSRFAAERGHVHILVWLHQQAGSISISELTCQTAAGGGHIASLQWLRAQGCPWDANTCSAAARDGHLEVLQWARRHGCPWNVRVCSHAASGGHLDILQWARAHGCPWSEQTFAAAALSGHLNILQWLRENNCPWDTETCAMAAKGGHLHILMWLRTQGCPWDARTCALAAGEGHLDILQWARKNGCAWSFSTTTNAAWVGHLETLQWARLHGCPWSESTCAMAAKNGHFTVLRWLKENGCPWNADTCSSAAESGNLEMLKWARLNGCPWDEVTCVNAAKCGNLEMLKWARLNGCPWDIRTCETAAMHGYLDVLQWAHNNGCLWSESTCYLAVHRDRQECFEWAIANGCPSDYDTRAFARKAGWNIGPLYADESDYLAWPWTKVRRLWDMIYENAMRPFWR